MNIEKYIESGILEAYLLGEGLSDEECAEVKAMAAVHPAIMEEMRAIEETLGLLAESTAIAPRTGLKQETMKRVYDRSAMTEKRKERVVPIREGGGRRTLWAVASVVVVLFTSTAALYFWNLWKGTEQRLDGLNTQNERLLEDNNAIAYRLEQVQQDLVIANGKDYRRITMNSKGSSESMAYVYWNERNQDVYLSVISLPQPPADKQYQLWALKGGRPIDAGVFDLGEDISLKKMKPTVLADAFAITLEPSGGSPSPTLTDLQVMGEVNL